MKSCNIFQHRAGHRKNFNEVVKHEKRMKCVELQPRLLLIKMRFSVVYVYSFFLFSRFCFVLELIFSWYYTQKEGLLLRLCFLSWNKEIRYTYSGKDNACLIHYITRIESKAKTFRFTLQLHTPLKWVFLK